MPPDPWNAIAEDFSDLFDLGRMLHVALRLLVATALGGVLGYQRESFGKPAGLRTFMLVAAGTALFVIAPQLEGATQESLSRVIQGIAAGIGFLGAGAILKLTDQQEIQGLTTAAGIWFTAAMAIAVGSGRLGTALVGTFMAFIILSLVYRWEQRLDKPSDSR